MSKLTYRAYTSGVVVSPVGEPICSERATHIEIDDEGAGAFVTVKQLSGRVDREGISIDATEWPLIRKAIDDMLAVAQDIEAEPLPKITGGGNG